MYEFWYDYGKPKYGEKVKLCFMETDSSIVYTKPKGTSDDVDTRFHTSSYKLGKP